MARRSRIGIVKEYLLSELSHYRHLEDSAAEAKNYEDEGYYMSVRIKIEKAIQLCGEEKPKGVNDGT